MYTTEVTNTYNGSIYMRRSGIVDPQQQKHVENCRPWLTPGDCTCRTYPDGTYYNACVNANCDNIGKACGGYCSECYVIHQSNVRFLLTVPRIDYHYLVHQRQWCDKTFGPGDRTAGLIDHISKELVEVAESDGHLSEWVDIIILAFDGAMRSAVTSGFGVEEVLRAIVAKQMRNESREWPDWRTADPNKAIEHTHGSDVDDE